MAEHTGTRRTADGGTITDGIYSPDWNSLSTEELREMIAEYIEIGPKWRAANPLSAGRYDELVTTLAARTAPPRAPQPIHYLQTNKVEEAAVRAIADTVADKLGWLDAVEKIHHNADQIDVMLDNGTLVRVAVAVLR